MTKEILQTENPNELQILQSLISSLTPLDGDTRLRLLETAVTFLRIDGIKFTKPVISAFDTFFRTPANETQVSSEATRSPSGPFSDRPDLSPKEFMLDKDPESDVEKVTCLAFYLTHYRNLPEFKTLDISKLNTEAAQVKFSNPAKAVDNATTLGFLVPAAKGLKQLGALGEQFVRALPDRDAASAIRAKLRGKRNKRSNKQTSPGKAANDQEE